MRQEVVAKRPSQPRLWLASVSGCTAGPEVLIDEKKLVAASELNIVWMLAVSTAAILLLLNFLGVAVYRVAVQHAGGNLASNGARPCLELRATAARQNAGDSPARASRVFALRRCNRAWLDRSS